MGCVSSKNDYRAEEGAVETRKAKVVKEGPDVRSGDAEVVERSKKVLVSLLTTKDRRYLVDKAGRKVDVAQLRGMPVAILFSAFAVPSAREFTRQLMEVYKELKAKGRGLEVVFLHNDESMEVWKQSMKEMGWLAVPFSDSAMIDAAGQTFDIQDLPTLVLLDQEGRRVTNEGVEVIKTHGAKAWPFSEERIQNLKISQSVDGDSVRRGGAGRQLSENGTGEEPVNYRKVAPDDTYQE